MKGYVCAGLTINIFGEAIIDVIWSCENIEDYDPNYLPLVIHATFL